MTINMILVINQTHKEQSKLIENIIRSHTHMVHKEI